MSRCPLILTMLQRGSSCSCGWRSVRSWPEAEYAQVTSPQIPSHLSPHPQQSRCHQRHAGKREEPAERYADVVARLARSPLRLQAGVGSQTLDVIY